MRVRGSLSCEEVEGKFIRQLVVLLRLRDLQGWCIYWSDVLVVVFLPTMSVGNNLFLDQAYRQVFIESRLGKEGMLAPNWLYVIL